MMATNIVLRCKTKSLGWITRFMPLMTSRRDVNVSHPAYTSKGSRHDSFLPFWKAGSGHYGNTLGQMSQDAVSSSEDLVLSYIDTVTVNPNGVFTIADYGTNDGYASMSLMNSIIGQLRRKYGEQLPIQIIYEDQAKNDFNSLFNRLSDDTSYMSNFSNVYPFATNINFYERCVPDETCDVIFTSTAVHWLETVDLRLKDSLFHFLSTTEEERRHFQFKAEQDWNKFLLHRASELKSGGLLVAFILSASHQFKSCNLEEMSFKKPSYPTTGQIVGFTVESLGITSLDFLSDLDGAWKKLLNEHVISQEEYEACNINLYFRTPKEITSPFEAADSPVTAAGLQLVFHDQFVPSYNFKASWWEKLQKEGIDDRKSFAESIVTAVRVLSQSLVEGSLSDTRSAQQKTAVVERLYKVMEDRVCSKDPRTYKSNLLMARLVARKA